uniref:Uncharacterized protein n=1 Tax=Oryza glumipatula TaxID=40148 RepID=A0A0D9ZAU2_9ORYZ
MGLRPEFYGWWSMDHTDHIIAPPLLLVFRIDTRLRDDTLSAAKGGRPAGRVEVVEARRERRSGGTVMREKVRAAAAGARGEIEEDRGSTAASGLP